MPYLPFERFIICHYHLNGYDSIDLFPAVLVPSRIGKRYLFRPIFGLRSTIWGGMKLPSSSFLRRLLQSAGQPVWCLLWPYDRRGELWLSEQSTGLSIEGVFKSHSNLDHQNKWWPRREWEKLIPKVSQLSKTRRAACVWLDGDLLGVVGVLVSALPKATLVAKALARELRIGGDHARTVAELDGCLYLLDRSDRPLMLLNRSGQILASTAMARALLRLHPHPVSQLLEVTALNCPQFPRGVRLSAHLWCTVSPLPVRHLLAPVLFLVALNTNHDPVTVGQPKKPLTKSEQTVAILLQQRLSNKELASRLGVSPNTIRHHVSKVLMKLGFNDRIDYLLASRPVPALSEPPPISSKAIANAWRAFDPLRKMPNDA